MDKTNFETVVLDGLEEIGDRQSTLLKNYEQLHRDTKSAFEDLTKVKNQQNDITATVRALQSVNLQLNREQRMAFGDPLERLLSDEEHRTRLNAIFRAIAR